MGGEVAGIADEIFMIFASVFVFEIAFVPALVLAFVTAIAFVFVPELAFVCQRTNLIII